MSADQSSLFDEPVEPHKLARSSDPETSHAAAESITPTAAAKCRRAVYFELDEPMIDDELVQKLPDWTASGVRTRRKELVRRGLVRPTGRRRKTRRGREADEYRAVPADVVPWDEIDASEPQDEKTKRPTRAQLEAAIEVAIECLEEEFSIDALRALRSVSRGTPAVAESGQTDE